MLKGAAKSFCLCHYFLSLKKEKRKFAEINLVTVCAGKIFVAQLVGHKFA